MRRQRLLRTSSAHSVCFFCANRLARIPIASSHRTISTTERLRQEPISPNNALNATATTNDPPGFTYNPNSSLSLSEQRQRAFLAARRELSQREEAEREARREAQRQEDSRLEQVLRQQREERRQQQDQLRTQRQRSVPFARDSIHQRHNISDGAGRTASLFREQTQDFPGRPRQAQSQAARTEQSMRSAQPTESVRPVTSPFLQAASPETRTQSEVPSSRNPLKPDGGSKITRGWGRGPAVSPVRRETVAAANSAPSSPSLRTPVSLNVHEGAERSRKPSFGMTQETTNESGPTGTGYQWRPRVVEEQHDGQLRGRSEVLEENEQQWSYLRRKAPDPALKMEQYEKETAQEHNQEWIDSVFNRHRATREAPGLSSRAPSAFDDPSRQLQNPKHRNTKCFRCGQRGHTVQECTVPRPEDSDRRLREGDRSTRVTRIMSRGGVGKAAPHSAAEVRPGDVIRESVSSQEAERAAATQERRMRKFAIEDEQDEAVGIRGRKASHDDRKREKGNRRGYEEEEEDDLDEDDIIEMEERKARRAERKAQNKEKNAAKAERRAAQAEARKKDGTPIQLPEFVTVATLAQLLNVRYEVFVERLEELGYDDVFPGKALNSETSSLIAMDFGFDPSSSTPEQSDRDLYAQPELADKSMLPVRPPVVTIMGHVDHGKTTILDYLRKSSVAAGEAGGITQHIGAFSVPLAASGKTITFLDTPGHAAFLAMRQRGATVTDIVILVVAADDSVKPQTLEAIKHAQGAGVPMIVAVNKVDKEQADIQRVKQDLARHGVEIEDFGGDTQIVPVSGKTGQGMDDLEENIVTLSEILDHRAEADGVAEGWVLEASTKKSGRVATVLVRRGTLKVGSIVVAGKTWARVRTLHNEAGVALSEVGPGMPAEIDGWRDQPMAGDEVLEAPSEQKANDVVDYRQSLADRSKVATDMEAINAARKARQDEQRMRDAADMDAADVNAAARPATPVESGRTEVPLIIKADVSGSAEAVTAYIQTLANPLVSPLILESSVGPIHESDIERADAARGHIVSFNLTNDEGLKNSAQARGIKVLENNIIYRILEDVKAVLEDTLPPIVTQRVLGEAEISASFDIGIGGRKTLKIAGCKVRNGVVNRGSRVRVTRGDEKIYDGTISTLKNVKKDVQEMRKGTECGMSFEDWQNFEIGDTIQTYEEVSEKRRL